jgi:predicted nucleotide-binding protein (sugar kinase/HSP70/actin superfamily)
VDGVIYLIAFECGPDALIKVLMDSEARKHPGVAYMSLVLDEHSGEAGMNTRVEAFLDAIVRRKKRAESGAGRGAASGTEVGAGQGTVAGAAPDAAHGTTPGAALGTGRGAAR